VVIVAYQFDGTAEQAAPVVDVFPADVMGEPSRPTVISNRTGQ
jgi:hypothetical protein